MRKEDHCVFDTKLSLVKYFRFFILNLDFTEKSDFFGAKKSGKPKLENLPKCF